EQKTAHFILPGELAYSNELLTEMRRWQVLSTLDRWIGAADEVWVYNTDDYLDSWWTQGEIVTIAYRKAAGSYYPKLRVYDYKSGTLIDPPAIYLPQMTKVQVRRMARWFANTDPWTMGPEGITPIRITAE